jgi:hypothetical protein
LTDRNPQTFTNIPHPRPDEFQKSPEQVFRQKDAASGVEVLVLPNHEAAFSCRLPDFLRRRRALDARIRSFTHEDTYVC